MNEKSPFDPDLTNPDIDLGDLDKTQVYHISETEESESEHALEELVDIDQANALIQGKILEHGGLKLKNAHFEPDWSIVGEDDYGGRILIPKKDAAPFLRSLIEK